MVRTVTRKTPNKKSTWYRLGKSANKKLRKSSSSRRKELNKLKSMKKVTKRILEEKLKKSYLHDGYNWKKIHLQSFVNLFVSNEINLEKLLF